jgi:ketosteroid isomerase-like protein
VIPIKQSRRRNLVIEVVVIAAFFLIAIVVTAIALTSGGSDPRRPLSNAEVAQAARGFASAYAREDARALARLLSPDVQRVSASDVQKGRSAVVSAYRSQFRAQVTRGYHLNDLQVSSGSVGRAQAQFTVERAGRPPITGQVVLGIERRNGKPRIRLIATESRT